MSDNDITPEEEDNSGAFNGSQSNSDEIEGMNNSTNFFSKLKKGKNGHDSDKEDKKREDLPKVPYLQLFRFATRKERALIALAFVAAAIHGSLMPLFTILFGEVINKFSDLNAADFDIEDITNEIGGVAKWFLVLGAIAFVSSFVQVWFMLLVAHGISGRLRSMYFESVMRQDATWFDEREKGELTARVASDINVIQKGIGDKVTSAVQFLSMFAVGIVIAFVHSWRLTLIILAVAPLLAICGALFGRLTVESTGDGLGAYGAAGAVATETLNLIRIVTAYGGQEEEARRYEKELDKAYKADSKKAVYTGLGLGATMFIILGVYAIAFYSGSEFVRNGIIPPGNVLIAFFSVLIAAMSIGQAAPSFSAFAAAQGAAPYVYDVIDHQSDIDPLDDKQGKILDYVEGKIELENVDFNYKTRVTDDEKNPAAPQLVLDKLSLTIDAGTTQALVGPSGCGKSTMVRLIERFYDVSGGRVLIDGEDVRELNVRWLRSQIGYVAQMPTLFQMSIRENIALGASLDASVDKQTGKLFMRRREVSNEEIISSAKLANAHDFIMKLPEGYDTMLGERGAMLSGGQKQRICIARALIRNPKILILDESTAALDARTEHVVQDALDRASEGRTTIIIAHRLSTVKKANRISVLQHGVVVESGKYDELMRCENGAFRKLVELQNVQEKLAQKRRKEADEDEDAFPLATAGPSMSSTVHKSLGDTVHGTSADSPPTFIAGGQEGDESVPNVDPGILKRAMKFNLKEWPLMAVGIFGAIIAGATWPVMSLVFAEVLNILIFLGAAAENGGTPPNGLKLPEGVKGDVEFWVGMFVVIGFAAFLGNAAQLGTLGISGERLTRRLRGACFRALLRQEMGYFDAKENSVGALTTKLATEASLVKGVTGDILGGVSIIIATLAVGLVIAFSACWRVALVVLSVVPFMAIAGQGQMKMMSGFDSDSEKEFASAGAIASEAVDSMDTVSGIGVQDYFIGKYNEMLEGPLAKGRKSGALAGIAFGFAEFIAQALWAVSFWAGSEFVRQEQCGPVQDGFLNLMKAISGLLFAGMSLGQASTFLPDVAKSRVAATQIFRLLDRESKIDPTSPNGIEIATSTGQGSVAAEKLKFEYPRRPDVPVLRGLSFSVSPGKTLALVGQSGCGKSTVQALLERFYDPRDGKITFDEKALDTIKVQSLRSQMGYVAQEPDLFDRSVRDNIAYGLCLDDGTAVTENEIIAAAKAANAHDFIMALPDGYDTVVGSRGSRLSGGQRQRVAIARSLVRNPKVLLLDEATSALDAASERVVQDALDAASSGRTTIAIAHRLSTIKDADIIAVVSRGKVVEVGNHDELMKKHGAYRKLVKNQVSQQ